MRWYHWITTYMIIGGGLSLGTIGGQFGGWFIFICLASIVVGVLGTKYLLSDPNKM